MPRAPRSRTVRSRAVSSLAAALALAAPLALSAPAATAASTGDKPPNTIELADGSQPEGIAKGYGTRFYAGARSDGAIYRADARTGSRTLLVPGREGGAARGMMLDRETGLLWVAGDERTAGTTETVSTVIAYDARSGERVRRIVVPGQRFLNDVQVTEDAVYVTDSRSAELVVVTGRGSRLLPLIGDYVQPPGFGANGIRQLRNGKLVITSGGVLYRVNPGSGVARVIQLEGRRLTSGDGLELRGRTLYVVYGFSTDEVAVVELAVGGRSGVVTGAVGNPDRLDRPTTAVLVAGDLYAVNGRFSVPPTPETEYTVTRIFLP